MLILFVIGTLSLDPCSAFCQLANSDSSPSRLSENTEDLVPALTLVRLESFHTDHYRQACDNH